MNQHSKKRQRGRKDCMIGGHFILGGQEIKEGMIGGYFPLTTQVFCCLVNMIEEQEGLVS